MTVNDFLSRLQGVTSDGKDGWMACCPAHDDHNPSMHVNEGADGRVLVKCYAGCSTADIVAAMGLQVKDLMPARPGHTGRAGVARKGKDKGGKASGQKGGKRASGASAVAGTVDDAPKARKKRPSKHICYYDYKREDGAIEFRVDRRVYTDEKGGKTFVQMSPDPSAPTGWAFGVASRGVEYIPYQLPLIRKAAAAGRPVIILEGEKDVCTIIKRLKLAATCNAKGAGKWSVGFGRYFEGVPSILIIADKDPATVKDEKTGEDKIFLVGQRHACDVERKLRADGYQGKIRKICMPDVGDRHVKDFTDWVEAMEAAKRTVDKSSFQAAIEEFGAWPDEWTFNDDDLSDLQRAQKARHSASDMPGESSEGEKRKDGRGKMGESGRFGRPCPRAPLQGREWYQVDFQMDPGRIARLNVCIDAIQFEGWQRSERVEDYGEFVQMATYDPIKCPAARMVSMAIGCMDSFSRNFKLQNPQRTELMCMLALAWLRSRGKFFADLDNPMYSTSLYFDGVDGVLYNIQSNEFQSFLATEVNISRENKVFKFMMALIEDMTMMKDVTPRVRPSKEWDRRGDVIYVSNGDSRMYKVSPGKIEDVANGTDGVVFLRGSTLLPFKLLDGNGVDPFIDSMLFKNAALESELDVMNCRLWTLNLFSCDQNKPILLINGPRGSGKTFLIQGIKQFLGIRTNGQLDDTVNRMDHSDKGAESFWIIIDKGRFEIFDNFDYKIKWADNDLQAASTGGTHKTRELYKTDVLVTLFARAFIALTSNNAVFASEGGGLPDRIIKVGTIGRPKVSKGPAELKADNMGRRDQYLTFILRTLSAALADTRPVDPNINLRHPEFAEFAVRCGRAMGCESEAIRALSRAEIEKSVLPIMNDTVAKEVVAVLITQPEVGNLSFTAGEMSDMIIKRIDDDDADDKTKTIYGSRRIGKAIQRFQDDFKTIFNYSTRVLEGKTKYEFVGMTDRGRSVIDSLRGGLVGFKTQFPKSPIGNGVAGEVSENCDTNAPFQPYARAQTQDISFNREGESNRDIADDLESGDLDDAIF